jgi:hypothetical protein
MHERVKLLPDGIYNAWCAMAYIYHSDAAGKVQKPVSIHVFKRGTFRACREN